MLLLFPESSDISRPLRPLKQRAIIQIPDPIVVELHLKLILHQLINVLHFVKSKPLEHPEPLGRVKDVEGCQAT